MAAHMSPEEEIKILRDRVSQLTQDLELRTKERDESITEITPLTFTNLLTLCHQEIAQVHVQPNRSSCTTGNLGDPQNKLVPRELRSWDEFPKLQRDTFDRVDAIYRLCREPPKTFPSPHNIITSLKPRISKPLASEIDLRKQQSNCVEDIFEIIVQDLIDNRELPDDFELGSGIVLDNHANQLTKEKEEELRSLIAKWADKIFIRRSEGDGHRLILIIEYKPPHKLSLEKLEAGLKELDILELIHRATISNDKTAKFTENSEAAVAVVLAQVYTYMVDSGIQYAYLTTGEAFVFLHIPDRKWNTLYYHMVIPRDASADGTVTPSLTSIGLVLSFYVLACKGELQNQDSRLRHRNEAANWIKDDERLLANVTPSPEKPKTPSSNYKSNTKRHAPTHSQSNPSRKLRSFKPGETPSVNAQARKDDSDSDGDDGASFDPFVSALPGAARASQGTSSQSTNKASQSQNETSSSTRKRHENYCSHQCLLGLSTKGALDPSCANYDFHPRVTTRRGIERHAISVVQLRELLLAQIQKTMNTNIEPLGIQGSRGAIFKLTLESHGYTMIGKGTPPHYVPDLRHEKAVYSHLHEIQGTTIPVCLGAIDSPRRYFYDVDVDIYHWLLMSFAGKSLDWGEFEACKPTRDAMRNQLVRYGIFHPDLSPNNFLWDEAAKKLMVIDFEGVTLATKKEEETPVKKEKATLLKEMSRNMILRKRKAVEDGEEVVVRPTKIALR